MNRYRKNPFPQLQATTYNANCSVDSYSESSSPADNLESFDYFGLERAHLALYKTVGGNFLNPNRIVISEIKKVENTWNRIMANTSGSELQEFIEIAISHDELNKLYPYTNLYTLNFSRCPEFPFDSKELPNVTPKTKSYSLPKEVRINENEDIDEITFIVTKNKNEYLGEGNAAEVLKIVKANLPEF